MFFSSGETAETVPGLVAAGVEFELLADAADDVRALPQRMTDGADLLVVDHYGRDATFEDACRPWARRILVLDDATGRDCECDLLLDAAATDSAAYRGHVPAHARLLLGPAYATLRPEFLARRKDALARRDGRPVRNILVSLGATDPANATYRVLDALEPVMGDSTVTVVSSSRAPHLAEIRRRAYGAITLRTDVTDMAGVIANADLAIGAAGSSAYERAVLGLPTVLVTLANNQRGICDLFDKTGAAVNVGEVDGTFAVRLQTAVSRLMTDPSARLVMASAASALVDGRGAQRVLLAILGEVHGRNGVRVTLRLADTSDEVWLLDLQREPGTRAYARNPAVPTLEEHTCWMRRVLADPDVELMLIEADGVAAGMLRLDRLNGDTQPPHYEVSIAIGAVHQHKGIASAALELARRFKPDAVLEAEILSANVASIELFRRAGYIPESATRYRSEPALNPDSQEQCQRTSP